jgi:hypothetical protein
MYVIASFLMQALLFGTEPNFTRDAQIRDILEVDILSCHQTTMWTTLALNGSSFSVECLILIPWLARVILHLCIPRLGIVTHGIIIRLICSLFCQLYFFQSVEHLNYGWDYRISTLQ